MTEKSNASTGKITKLLKNKGFLISTAFVLGLTTYGFLRFALVERHQIHSHANFALYINGKRDEFKSFTYYEEITSCTNTEQNNPKSRVHMHGNINNVIHVHDEGATWSHFFSNIGYVFADDFLRTSAASYLPTDENKFTYILNGEIVDNVADKVIDSEDKLLISYGNESEQILRERFEQIEHTAHEYNEKSDPSTCSGGAGETIIERLKRTQLH